MRRHIIFLLLLLIPFFLFADDAFESNLVTAKRKAATEGKLLMLDFTAKWCAPCQFMEEHTFLDGRVNNYFNASFVPVKIDIDDFDGYALKQRYDVNVLPTIIILNSKGELLQKYEESMAPSRLLQIMEIHDRPTNKVITIVEPEPEPLQDDGIVSAPESEVAEAPIFVPPLESTEPNINTSPTDKIPRSEMPAPEIPIYPELTPNIPSTNTEEGPLVSGSGLFKFSVESQASTGYSVQIGAFYQYENVLIQVSQLQQMFDYIIVNANRFDGNPVYKIMLGHFEQIEDARAFAEEISASGMAGSFVINLETLR